jgi:ATP-dependent DNA helicase RecQ
MRASQRVCVTRTVFEMIEPDAAVPPCGRCPACRAETIAPPASLPSAGLEAVWEAEWTGTTSLPPGLLLIAPDDTGAGADARLLTRLARAGIEQFLLPPYRCASAAEMLANLPGRGFILDLAMMNGQARLARLPTALVVAGDARDASFALDRVRIASSNWSELPFLVVAEPESRVEGRRLDQTLSQSAPIPERVLDSYTCFGARAA